MWKYSRKELFYLLCYIIVLPELRTTVSAQINLIDSINNFIFCEKLNNFNNNTTKMTLERENEIQALFENEIADVECHINVPDSMSHLKFCYFKLKKNNLRVLVVSDPTTKKVPSSIS